MKGSFYIVLLSAAFQCAVLQEECPTPTPAECVDVVGTCDNITCPLTNKVKCCVELVDGKCTPKVLQLPSLTDITNQCIKGRGSCSTKKCAEGMACLENVLECPTSETGCGIREVQASCILLEISRTPSSCNDIVCLEDSTCVVSQNALGTKAECKKNKPKSCADITCDDGMSCIGRNTPRCIPRRPSESPIDCSQLECPEDLICLLLDKTVGPKCAKLPPATSCGKLNCTQRLTCKPMKDTSEVKCVQEQPLLSLIDRDCNKLDCEEGNECKLVINRKINRNLLPVATCLPTECPRWRSLRPPATCEDIKCKSDEVCVLCGEGIQARAWCKPNDIRELLEGNEILESMLSVETDTSSLTPTGQSPIKNNTWIPRPPISCDELICQPQLEKCQVLLQKNKTLSLPIALCVSEDTPDKCEDAKCNEETEICTVLENDEVTVARCVPTESNNLNTLTNTSKNISRRSLAKRCEELECGGEAECMQLLKNGTKRALCMKLRKNAVCQIPSAQLDQPQTELDKLNIIVDANPDAVLDEKIKKDSNSLNLPDTCMERRCCEGKTCVIEKGRAICIPENRKEKILTCDKLLCQKGLECIMRLKENGKKKGAMCRPIRRRDINPTTAPPPGDSETKGRRRRPVKPKM